LPTTLYCGGIRVPSAADAVPAASPSTAAMARIKVPMAAVLFWFRMVEVPLAGEGLDGLATLETMDPRPSAPMACAIWIVEGAGTCVTACLRHRLRPKPPLTGTGLSNMARRAPLVG